jgi:hypothetical protein
MEQEKYILFVYFYSQLELHSNSIVSNTNVLYILTIADGKLYIKRNS